MIRTTCGKCDGPITRYGKNGNRCKPCFNAWDRERTRAIREGEWEASRLAKLTCKGCGVVRKSGVRCAPCDSSEFKNRMKEAIAAGTRVAPTGTAACGVCGGIKARADRCKMCRRRYDTTRCQRRRQSKEAIRVGDIGSLIKKVCNKCGGVKFQGVPCPPCLKTYSAVQWQIWSRANPDMISARCAKYRSMKANSLGVPPTHAEFIAIKKRRCVDCGSRKNIEVDHIVPLAAPHNGAHVLLNLAPRCRHCNATKHAKLYAGVEYSLFDQPSKGKYFND